MKEEVQNQLKAIVEELAQNYDRRQTVISKIMDIEDKIRYLETNKQSLQSNPNYDRVYIELCNERSRLNKYVGQ